MLVDDLLEERTGLQAALWPGANIRFFVAIPSITSWAVSPAHAAPMVDASAFPVLRTMLKPVLKLSLGIPAVWLASIRSVISLPPAFQSPSGRAKEGSSRRTGVSIVRRDEDDEEFRLS
jgi:hypothetical protein